MEEKVVDTRLFQLGSLDDFMYILGYARVGLTYVARPDAPNPAPRSRARLSFKTAVRIHNYPAKSWGTDSLLRFTHPDLKHIVRPIDVEYFHQLLQAKRCERVYLVENKRNRTIHVNQHLVEFTNPIWACIGGVPPRRLPCGAGG